MLGFRAVPFSVHVSKKRKLQDLSLSKLELLQLYYCKVFTGVCLNLAEFLLKWFNNSSYRHIYNHTTSICCIFGQIQCLCAFETDTENKCCFWAGSIRELVSLLVCVCVHKGGGCRQTGSRGLQNRTGHHNSSSRSLATDRQAGLNGDCSLIGIYHQQPTKSISPWGKPRTIFRLKGIHGCIQYS